MASSSAANYNAIQNVEKLDAIFAAAPPSDDNQVREDIDVPNSKPAPTSSEGSSSCSDDDWREVDDGGHQKLVLGVQTKLRTWTSQQSTAFSISNILNKTECDAIMHNTKELLVDVEQFFEQRYRRCERALVMVPALGKLLFSRLAPHIKTSDYAGKIPLCFGHEGVWVPLQLNPCFKVVRYAKGGMFVPHRDGPWVPREDQASLFTVVVYLNDGFGGGKTQLLGSDLRAPIGQRMFRSTDQASVEPVAGAALLFNHDCWHAGDAVTLGEKWILRTEMIFQRVYSFYVDKNKFTHSAEYKKTMKLYHDAQAALERGDRATFVDTYQEVIQRQQDAMCGAEGLQNAQQKCLLVVRLADDALGAILMYATDSEVLELMLTAKGMFLRVANSTLWQHRCGAQFPLAFAALTRRALDANPLSGHFRHLTTPIFDWFTHYKQLKVAPRRGFLPAVVSVAGGRALLVRHRDTPSWFSQNHGGQTPGGSLSSCVKQCPLRVVVGGNDNTDSAAALGKQLRLFDAFILPEFFGGWRYSYPLHANQPMGERFPLTNNITSVEKPKCIVEEKTRVARDEPREEGFPDVHWSILCSAISYLVDVSLVPLIIVADPLWFRDEPVAPLRPRRRVYQNLESAFEATRAPAIAVVHPALAALLAIGSVDGDVGLAGSTSAAAAGACGGGGISSMNMMGSAWLTQSDCSDANEPDEADGGDKVTTAFDAVCNTAVVAFWGSPSGYFIAFLVDKRTGHAAVIRLPAESSFSSPSLPTFTTVADACAGIAKAEALGRERVYSSKNNNKDDCRSSAEPRHVSSNEKMSVIVVTESESELRQQHQEGMVVIDFRALAAGATVMGLSPAFRDNCVFRWMMDGRFLRQVSPEVAGGDADDEARRTGLLKMGDFDQ